MNARTKYVLSFSLAVFFIAFFVFGPLGLSVRKKFDFKKIIPVPKYMDEARLNLSINHPSENYLSSVSTKLKPTPSKLKVPKYGAYLGVSSGMSNLNRLESITGKKFSIVQEYVNWGQRDSSFNFSMAGKLWVDNKILIIAWLPAKSVRNYAIDQPDYRLQNILKGKYNSYLNDWVIDIKNWKRPVIIRFAPEMNGDWLPWGTLYTTPQEYRKTFRYVVDMFRAKQVNNVSWMWSPNVAINNEDIVKYYPGDDYVDWIGLSGFNWGGLESFNSWRTFEEIYKESINQLKDIDKPIALTEIGSVESKTDPQAKGDWIQDTFDLIKNKYPQIKLVGWSNNKSFKKYDWRIDTSSYSLWSFKQAVTNSYYLSKINRDDL